MSSSHAKKPVRISLTASAVLAGSVAASLAGIAAPANAAPSGPAGSQLFFSNGTDHLASPAVPDRIVASAMTDAAFSPDGSRIAFIDAHGNLVNSDPKGGDPIVLTTAAAGTVRSHPTWEDGGAEIVFTETVGSAPSKLMSVDANGLTLGQPSVEQALLETAGDTTSDSNPDFAGGGFVGLSRLVYQHHNATTNADEIWILDRNTRGPAGSKLVDGTNPSISPDGNKVAFVDAAGKIESVALPIPVVNNAPAPVITAVPNQFGTTYHYSHLAWSPDGTSLAFEAMTPGTGGAADKAVGSGAIKVADGSVVFSAPSTPGVPTWVPLTKHHVDRIAGGDRLATAIDASQAYYRTSGSQTDPRWGSANSVVISRSDQFADALGGSALANNVGGPLLLTPTGDLDTAVQAEISRVLGPVNAQSPKTIYLLGGEMALSAKVETTAKGMGYNVVRLAGADRYSTSVAIATKMTTASDGTTAVPRKIMVATGVKFADALSAGAAASGDPVVLTADTVMPKVTADFLNRFTYTGTTPVKAYAIGGQANTAMQSLGFGSATHPYTDIHGADRYATSTLVAKTFFDGPTRVGFATGLNWADALSGGALMGNLVGPLILTDPAAGPDADTTAWLQHTGPQLGTALIFGGTAAVSANVDGAVGNAIGGAAGYDKALNPQDITP